MSQIASCLTLDLIYALNANSNRINPLKIKYIGRYINALYYMSQDIQTERDVYIDGIHDYAPVR